MSATPTPSAFPYAIGTHSRGPHSPTLSAPTRSAPVHAHPRSPYQSTRSAPAPWSTSGHTIRTRDRRRMSPCVPMPSATQAGRHSPSRLTSRGPDCAPRLAHMRMSGLTPAMPRHVDGRLSLVHAARGPRRRLRERRRCCSETAGRGQVCASPTGTDPTSTRCEHLHPRPADTTSPSGTDAPHARTTPPHRAPHGRQVRREPRPCTPRASSRRSRWGQPGICRFHVEHLQQQRRQHAPNAAQHVVACGERRGGEHQLCAAAARSLRRPHPHWPSSRVCRVRETRDLRSDRSRPQWRSIATAVVDDIPLALPGCMHRQPSSIGLGQRHHRP